jgi:uncharacterized delta-60 repeat protein
MRLTSLALSSLLLLGFGGIAFAAGASGILDSGFGTGGIVEQDPDLGPALDVAVDASDRIVTVGQYSIPTADGSTTAAIHRVIRRYDTSGALDTTFDGDGIVELTGATGGDVADAVAIAADGSIYVAGRRSYTEGKGRKVRTIATGYVARLLSDGTLDWQVDTGAGNVTELLVVPAGSTHEIVAATTEVVTVETSGGGKGKKGKGGGSSSSRALSILRYSTAGTLLSSWVDDVSATQDDVPRSIAVDGSGRIVVGFIQLGSSGTVDNAWGLTRYTTNGVVDTSFGDSGRVLGYASGTAELAAIAVDGTSGAIYAAGRVPGAVLEGIVVRYAADAGSSTELSVPDFGGKDLEVYDLTLDAEGRPVAVLWYDNVDWQVALARWTTAGALDTSFGPASDGTSAVLDLSDRDNAGPIAIDGSGRIVMAAQSVADVTQAWTPILVRWE